MVFINIGSHLIIDSPGKGCVITGCCSDLNPPVVRYKDGVRTYQIGTRQQVLEIIDSGQVLFSLGDFIQFNAVLPKRDYCNGLFRSQTKYKIDPNTITQHQIFSLKVPKIPSKYGLYLNNITLAEFKKLKQTGIYG